MARARGRGVHRALHENVDPGRKLRPPAAQPPRGRTRAHRSAVGDFSKRISVVNAT